MGQTLSTREAIQIFFNFDNHLFVKMKLKDKTATLIMSHGWQLDDLFTVLPEVESHRAFHRELTAMRSLCLKILEDRRVVA